MTWTTIINKDSVTCINIFFLIYNFYLYAMGNILNVWHNCQVKEDFGDFYNLELNLIIYKILKIIIMKNQPFESK